MNWAVQNRMTPSRIAVAVLVLLSGLAIVFGRGFFSSDVEIDFATTWLPYEEKGQLVHVAGPSADVDFVVTGVARPGDDLEVETSPNDDIFVLNRTAGVVLRIGPQTYAETARVADLATGPNVDIATGPNAFYLLDGEDGQITSLNQLTLEPEGELDVGEGPISATVDAFGHLWFIDPGSGELVEFDGTTELQRVEAGGAGDDLQVTLGENNQPGVFNLSDGTWSRPLDDRSIDLPEWDDEAGAAPVTTNTSMPSFTADGRWVAFDPGSGAVEAETTLGEGDRLGRPFVAQDRAYVANATTGEVAVIDSETGDVLHEVGLLDDGGWLTTHAVDDYAFAQTSDTSRAWVIDPDGEKAAIDLEDPEGAIVFHRSGRDVTEVEPVEEVEVADVPEEEVSESVTGVVVTTTTTAPPTQDCDVGGSTTGTCNVCSNGTTTGACTPCDVGGTTTGACTPCDVGGTTTVQCNVCSVGGSSAGPCNPCDVGGTTTGACNFCDVGGSSAGPCNPCSNGTTTGNCTPCEHGGTTTGTCNPCTIGGSTVGNCIPCDVGGNAAAVCNQCTVFTTTGTCTQCSDGSTAYACAPCDIGGSTIYSCEPCDPSVGGTAVPGQCPAPSAPASTQQAATGPLAGLLTLFLGLYVLRAARRSEPDPGHSTPTRSHHGEAP